MSAAAFCRHCCTRASTIRHTFGVGHSGPRITRSLPIPVRSLSFTRRREQEGLVLGVYEPAEKDGAFILTPAAQAFNQQTGGKLDELLKIAGRKLSSGQNRVLYGLDAKYQSVAIANLGKQDDGVDEAEQLDVARENVRTAVAGAVLSLRDRGEKEVSVDVCGYPEAAAEGCALCLFAYDELKHQDKRKAELKVKPFTLTEDMRSSLADQWSRGMILSEGQNFARYLKECPANKMTPSQFCEEVKSKMSGLPGVSVTVRDQAWAESMKMGAFISVAKGSTEPLKFLEIDYRGGKEQEAPVALVGKGVTFDSGGVSLKPAPDMDKMRGDMGGAAAVAGTFLAAAKLKLKLNLKGFIPLCENMINGHANKPGDVVTAMNGKTIQVDNTDAEGRLILSDALCYAETFSPQLIVDIATLTGAIAVALGGPVSGAFTKSETIWQLLQQAGQVTGDRVWRMPLLKAYGTTMTKADLADLNNIGSVRAGGSCTAAAFLKEFVTSDHWAHLDIAGTMLNKDDVPYMCKGMSGRPTRTVVHFLELWQQRQL